MSNKAFVTVAYAVAWIAILGYTIRLFLKGARAEAEFARAVREMEKTS